MRETIPPKGPIPTERVREVLEGPPRNAELQAAILERARAELVVRYRKNPQVYPDGIDHAGDRWYGDGSSWTMERLKAALSNDIFEGRLPKRRSVVPADAVVKVGRPVEGDREHTLTAKEPWAVAGVSKATWYRRRKPEGGKS